MQGRQVMLLQLSIESVKTAIKTYWGFIGKVTIHKWDNFEWACDTIMGLPVKALDERMTLDEKHY
jgi:hypothetical protein